jgi:hypothetical protein
MKLNMKMVKKSKTRSQKKLTSASLSQPTRGAARGGDFEVLLKAFRRGLVNKYRKLFKVRKSEI